MTVRAILRWVALKLTDRCTRCEERLAHYGSYHGGAGAKACMACDFGMHVVAVGHGWTHYESLGGATKYTVFHEES